MRPSMYAMTTKGPIETPTDFNFDEAGQLHYWRKHPDLHDWMQDLYYAKGGKKELNVLRLQLSSADLDRLEKAIKNGELRRRRGFFTWLGDATKDDLEFIRKARLAIEHEFIVFYDAC